MSHFIKSGNTYRVMPGDAVDINDFLPKGNYVLKNSPMTGFYLETSEVFQQPKKIYGDCLKHSDRIISTFKSRAENTGVMLVGEKGSGKTLLARQISCQTEYPTIIISSSYTGEQFNSFLSSITQPCIVLFDEFEKVYDKKDQEAILTLLDGTYQSQKLFIFTSNNKWELDANLKNRPGRIFYLLEFSGVGESFIREYCMDNLEDKNKIDSIISVSTMFDVFNFDMLAAFVQETNRYGEDPAELISLLNAKPEYSGRQYYVFRDLKIGDIDIPVRCQNAEINTTTHGFGVYAYFHWDRDKVKNSGVEKEVNKIFNQEDIDFDILISLVNQGILIPGTNLSDDDDDDNSMGESYFSIRFYPEDIIKYDGTNCVHYENDDKCKITLVKSAKRKKTFTLN